MASCFRGLWEIDLKTFDCFDLKCGYWYSKNIIEINVEHWMESTFEIVHGLAFGAVSFKDFKDAQLSNGSVKYCK